MFYWAHAVKVTFGGFDPVDGAGAGNDPSSVSQWRLLGPDEFSPVPTRQAVAQKSP